MQKVLVGVILFLWSTVIPLQAQRERVRSWDSHITVNHDGSILVQDRIVFLSVGRSTRVGLNRRFQTHYRTLWGISYTIFYDFLSVHRDGHAEPYVLDPDGDSYWMYMGHTDKILPAGEHTYEITYRTKHRLFFSANDDELYWEVNGRWPFPIDHVTATVSLPPRARDAVQIMRGYLWDPNHEFDGERDAQGNFVFRAGGEEPEQSFYVWLTWPKGIIHEPTRKERFDRFVADNHGVIIGSTGLVLAVLYYLVAGLALGRAFNPRTAAFCYAPPQGLSPAAMRYLPAGQLDDKGFAAAIVGLAAKRSLTIEGDAGGYRLQRTPSGAGAGFNDFSSDEQTLAGKLFADAPTVELTPQNQAALAGAAKALKNALQDKAERRHVQANLRYRWPGIAVTVLAAMTMVMATPGDASYAGVQKCLLLTGAIVGLIVLRMSDRRARKSVRAGGPWTSSAALTVGVFSLLALVGVFIIAFRAFLSLGLICVAIIWAGIGAGALVRIRLNVPARAARSMLKQVEGFKRFLRGEPAPAVAALLVPAKTTQLFERFLPYALALGLDQQWAKQFADDAAPGTATPIQLGYIPSWYSGTSLARSPADFISAFSNSFVSAMSSALAASQPSARAQPIAEGTEPAEIATNATTAKDQK
ncbi:MAG TPA: DUF2207 domain-containing protein [Candidatus Angelobacter sp.]|nr:DUF2207 domain-containing protein [Candidatus Angelobacter sp.]